MRIISAGLQSCPNGSLRRLGRAELRRPRNEIVLRGMKEDEAIHFGEGQGSHLVGTPSSSFDRLGDGFIQSGLLNRCRMRGGGAKPPLTCQFENVSASHLRHSPNRSKGGATAGDPFRSGCSKRARALCSPPWRRQYGDQASWKPDSSEMQTRGVVQHENAPGSGVKFRGKPT
jgi:hypothetical protein